MPHAPSIIPDIPGTELHDRDTRQFLNAHIGSLCGLRDGRFPGSQPVSFTTRSVELLEKMDFWVCEKTDGVRVLLFVVFNGQTGSQEVYLIDRKQRYFLIEDLHFTHWERLDDPLTDTLLDGELVIDVDPQSGQHFLRYYAFDCLVINGENIMKKPLVKRFARLRDWVVKPMNKAFARYPEWKEQAPFEIVDKKQELSYYTSRVLDVHVPKLMHGHDGLIFTCAESEYLPGTDERILKWKPPSENSVDFKIELRFPPFPENPSEPDFYAKPIFILNQWAGNEDYEYFDEMDVDDAEWEKMKESGEEFDGRVVEVTWDQDRGWKMFRFRDDKPHGNHKSIVGKVLVSIADGVEIADVLGRQDAIRTAWKEREARRNSRPPPDQQRQAQRPPSSASAPPPQGGGRPSAPPVVAGLRR
ncbi:Dcp1p-Dcp2p decapping enzyme complex alpha subunit [Vanrija albida]|uniref:mRNA-capping enzyme subunit alpha n=1 Tax=Vanrija albida TaxID=181172 RepID=A0ABR3Q8Y5_9TREE